MKIKEFIIIPSTIDAMGLIHKPGKGPNNRFDFKNKGNNRANERVRGVEFIPGTAEAMGLVKKNGQYGFKNVANNRANETKEAPPGTYFTKTGNLVKGRLTKAAKAKGARETDPKDSQRSKVPPVTQSNEEAAGVGIITKQNTTADVKPGETTRQANKLGLGLTKKGVPARSMREQWEEFCENFADGKKKGKSRPGRVKRAGASCKGSVTSLRAKAKKYGGERGKMYHWCANMKSGRSKKK